MKGINYVFEEIYIGINSLKTRLNEYFVEKSSYKAYFFALMSTVHSSQEFISNFSTQTAFS